MSLSFSDLPEALLGWLVETLVSASDIHGLALVNKRLSRVLRDPTIVRNILLTSPTSRRAARRFLSCLPRMQKANADLARAIEYPASRSLVDVERDEFHMRGGLNSVDLLAVLSRLNQATCSLQWLGLDKRFGDDTWHEDLPEIVKFMAGAPQLGNLELMWMPPPNLNAVRAFVSNSPALVTLTISHCRLSNVEAMAQMLVETRTLEWLILNCNEIADVSSLALALAQNASVRSLSMQGNKIADVSAFGTALRQNGTLRYLDLRDNAIADVTALAAGLAQNAVLISLELENNPYRKGLPLPNVAGRCFARE
jgi:hypothetical protein